MMPMPMLLTALAALLAELLIALSPMGVSSALAPDLADQCLKSVDLLLVVASPRRASPRLVAPALPPPLLPMMMRLPKVLPLPKPPRPGLK